ncbi:RNA-binding protein 42 [Dinochytrium kinnereticum]|nr:RNA-binding protein 42 [Dinochytrium kinnereticum]
MWPQQFPPSDPNAAQSYYGGEYYRPEGGAPYNPMEVHMASGFVSAAPPTLASHHQPPTTSSQHHTYTQFSASSTVGDQFDLKEIPYPEGYEPKSAASLEEKAKKSKTALNNAAAIAQRYIASKYSTPTNKFDGKKKKKIMRAAGGEVWEDPTLNEWDPNDFRLFCGDLGNEVTDDMLFRFFAKFPSLIKAKVVRDKRSSKTKGYGFVSFKDPNDFVKALKEMNGKYIGNRPIKLRKSNWDDRNVNPKQLHKTIDGAFK